MTVSFHIVRIQNDEQKSLFTRGVLERLEIYVCGVLKEYQHKGVGKALIKVLDSIRLLLLQKCGMRKILVLLC